MKSINDWFEEYSESHRNPFNKRVHFVCVPLIFFSITGLLMSIPTSLDSATSGGLMNFALLAIILALIFYLNFSSHKLIISPVNSLKQFSFERNTGDNSQGFLLLFCRTANRPVW